MSKTNAFLILVIPGFGILYLIWLAIEKYRNAGKKSTEEEKDESL